MDAILEPRQHPKTIENFCKRHSAGLIGTRLRTHYHNVLKEGRKLANGTSALYVAI